MPVRKLWEANIDGNLIVLLNYTTSKNGFGILKSRPISTQIDPKSQ